MSWSVSASGTPSEVRGRLSEQFKGPLAEKPAGLSDDGERDTVQRIADMIEQCLGTFDHEKHVAVITDSRSGSCRWWAGTRRGLTKIDAS
jgi:hypothetical protein